MIAYLFLGLALLLSLLLLARGLAMADPQALAKGVRYGGGAAAIGVALYLLISGRWPYAITALFTALPLLMRWRAIRDRFKAASGPARGKRSEIETAMLRMSLDLDSGEMSGTVLKGSAAGRSLEFFTLSELAALLEECRQEDPPSVTVLESYLDRRFGADWRAGDGTGGGKERTRRGPASSSAMTRHEALEILGLAEGASTDQIKDAYRHLMAKLHPDTGGSAYLAMKLNQARDLLLGG